jgi:hypothetical protein
VLLAWTSQGRAISCQKTSHVRAERILLLAVYHPHDPRLEELFPWAEMLLINRLRFSYLWTILIGIVAATKMAVGHLL